MRDNLEDCGAVAIVPWLFAAAVAMVYYVVCG